MSNFDFSHITQLTWAPWVGCQYHNNPLGKKVLLLGESHYYEDPEKVKSMDFTRDTIDTYCIKTGKSDIKFFNIVNLMFLNQARGNKERRGNFWSGVSFMNIVQEAMLFKDGRAQTRPNGDQYVHGWEAVRAVMEVIRPDVCIRLGRESYYQLEDQDPGGHHTLHNTQVGRYSLLQKYIKLVDGHRCRVLFVPHPSRYFSSHKWRGVLKDVLKPEGLDLFQWSVD